MAKSQLEWSPVAPRKSLDRYTLDTPTSTNQVYDRLYLHLGLKNKEESLKKNRKTHRSHFRTHAHNHYFIITLYVVSTIMLLYLKIAHKRTSVPLGKGKSDQLISVGVMKLDR